MGDMEPPVDILLFGDQTGDHSAVFRNVLQAKDDVFLTAFLQKTYLALRREVTLQPISKKTYPASQASETWLGDMLSHRMRSPMLWKAH